MSTEQPESALSQGETQAADITQQATSPTPTTKPPKNPKKVAAGKATAEKTRQEREAKRRKL